MEDNVKLSLDELEKAGGGIGGSPDPLPVHPGYICYQIRPGDNLTNLAKTYKTSTDRPSYTYITPISNHICSRRAIISHIPTCVGLSLISSSS